MFYVHYTKTINHTKLRQKIVTQYDFTTVPQQQVITYFFLQHTFLYQITNSKTLSLKTEIQNGNNNFRIHIDVRCIFICICSLLILLNSDQY